MADPKIFNLKCCRLCRSEGLLYHKSILDARPLQQTISKALGIEVQQGDCFSKSICVVCVYFINKFNAFKKYCLTNQQIFYEQLNSRNSEDSSDYIAKNMVIMKEPVDHDVIMTPVITEVETEPSTSPICEEREEDGKVINAKIRGTECPNNNNLRRHYKKIHAADTPEDTSDRSVHLNSNEITHAYKSTMLNNSNSDDGILVLCHICDELFISKEQLKRHKSIHEKMPVVLESGVDTEPNNKYQCSLCSKSYTAYSSLYHHNKMKHPENKTRHNRKPAIPMAPNLPVPEVSHVKIKNEMYRKHWKIQLAKKKEAKQFACTICQKMFGTKSALFFHQGWHKREKTAQKVVTSTEAMPKPIIIIVEDKVKCNTCGLSLLSDAALQTHISEKHRNGSM